MMGLPICLVEDQRYQHKSKELSPEQSVCMHCMGHSLNLAVQDTCRSIKTMRDTLDTVLELSNIF